MAEEIEAAAAGENEVPDQRLSLMFACAHPAIDAAVRAPLILQTILGFDAASIGSAFLVSPASMSQRLVRAKHKIREAGIRFEVPEGAELAARLHAVLEAIYAAFAEGWSDPAGADAQRRNLADEGIWLGRLVASLLPNEAEALGLLSLMLYAQARRDARRDAEGEYVPLAEQDPAAWDAALIDEAEALLSRASALPGAGRYQLEAAVQSAHVVRRKTGCSDWLAIERIYDALFVMTGSPVVALNRAIALAETQAPPRASPRSTRSRTRSGSPTTSPIGPRAPACWPGRAKSTPPTPPTSAPSASKATPRCAASSRGAAELRGRPPVETGPG